MPNSYQIKCIVKDDRYDKYSRITHVGGFGTSQWKLTVEEVIRRIEAHEEYFHTLVNGHRRNVEVHSRNGRKYIKTDADYDTPDNLLSLPSCP